MKSRSIFTKVFAYTMILTTLFALLTAVLFSRQYMSFFKKVNVNLSQTTFSLSSFIDDTTSAYKTDEDVANLGRKIYESNNNIIFYVVDSVGNQVYRTPNIKSYDATESNTFTDERIKGYTFILQDGGNRQLFYNVVIIPIIFISLALLMFCFICSFIFAKQITRPIEQLADETHKMANLEDVENPEKRNDEIGMLSEDVHSMYEKLKDTIKQLEDEILRERELEETQRYFFKMASHELKTPIASTSILLEGMIENVGDYKNHEKYLLECIKLMDSQSDIVSEILTISNLNDSNIRVNSETLNLRKVIYDVLEIFYTLTDVNKQNIIVTIDENETFVTDKNLFHKAISNIILNAIQNTPESQSILIYTDDNRLCILNTGAKVDENVLPKLFDSFYRTDNARGENDGRSGLGLAIVKKTLQTLNMDFNIENTKDGVLFWIDLIK